MQVNKKAFRLYNPFKRYQGESKDEDSHNNYTGCRG